MNSAGKVSQHFTIPAKSPLPGPVKFFLLQLYAGVIGAAGLLIVSVVLAAWIGAISLLGVLASLALGGWFLSVIISIHNRTPETPARCRTLCLVSLVLSLGTVLTGFVAVLADGDFLWLIHGGGQAQALLPSFASGIAICHIWLRYFTVSVKTAEAFNAPLPAAGESIPLPLGCLRALGFYCGMIFGADVLSALLYGGGVWLWEGHYEELRFGFIAFWAGVSFFHALSGWLTVYLLRSRPGQGRNSLYFLLSFWLFWAAFCGAAYTPVMYSLREGTSFFLVLPFSAWGLVIFLAALWAWAANDAESLAFLGPDKAEEKGLVETLVRTVRERINTNRLSGLLLVFSAWVLFLLAEDIARKFVGWGQTAGPEFALYVLWGLSLCLCCGALFGAWRGSSLAPLLTLLSGAAALSAVFSTAPDMLLAGDAEKSVELLLREGGNLVLFAAWACYLYCFNPAGERERLDRVSWPALIQVLCVYMAVTFGLPPLVENLSLLLAGAEFGNPLDPDMLLRTWPVYDSYREAWTIPLLSFFVWVVMPAVCFTYSRSGQASRAAKAFGWWLFAAAGAVVLTQGGYLFFSPIQLQNTVFYTVAPIIPALCYYAARSRRERAFPPGTA